MHGIMCCLSTLLVLFLAPSLLVPADSDIVVVFRHLLILHFRLTMSVSIWIGFFLRLRLSIVTVLPPRQPKAFICLFLVDVFVSSIGCFCRFFGARQIGLDFKTAII